MAGKNELKLIITADGKKALDTINATETSLKQLSTQTLKLEKALASGKEMSASMSDAIRLINDAVTRHVLAQKELNPAINENEAALKAFGKMIEAVSTQGGALGSETLTYLKTQYSTLNEIIQESIRLEEEHTRAMQEKEAFQQKYNASLQSIIRTNVLGIGEYNASGVRYNLPESYNDKFAKLLEEKELADKQALLDDWLVAKQAHENAVLKVEKIAQEESYKKYKDTLKAKKLEEEAYYKSIEENIKKQEENIKKQEALYESLNNKIKEQAALFQSFQNKAFEWSTGAGDTNAMGQAYKPNETYEQMWGRLLKEQDESIAKASELEKKSKTTFSSIVGSLFDINKLVETTFNVFKFRFIMNAIKIVAGLKDFLKDAVDAAAQAEQVFSKLNTVFDKTSNSMAKAISLSYKLGTSISTAASSLSTVGDLLQAQGMYTVESLETAYDWIYKFQDIIAFKDINMTLEEFAQNFMSGAAGNLRNFRTFGSIVRESAVNTELAKKGLDKLVGSELELAKMTTRAEMALAQQQNALGATQREWDTMLSIQRRYEESLKSFKENVGEYLSPISKWWIEIKTNILDALNAQLKYQKLTNTLKGGGQIEQIYLLRPDENTFDWTVFTKAVKDLEDLYKTSGSEATKMNYAQVLGFQYGMSPEDLDLALGVANANGAKFTASFIEKVVSDYIANTGISKINKKKTEEINTSITNANNLDKFLESIMAIDNRISFIGEEWYDTFVKSLNDATKGVGTVEELNRITRSTYKNIINSSIKEIEGMEIPSFEKLFGVVSDTDLLDTQREALKKLYQIAESTGKYTDKELNAIYYEWEKLGKEIDKINKENEAQKKWDDLGTQFSDSFGEFGTLISSFGSGGMPDLLSTLIQIVAQTEAFTKLSSILTDSILPVLNAFLEPLIPIIDQLSSIITNLVKSVLLPLFPILQGVAAAVAGLVGIVDATFSAMVSGIKLSLGYALGWIEDALNTVAGWFGGGVNWGFKEWQKENPEQVFNDRIDETKDIVKDILEYTMDIADNTSKDYDVYANLLAAKEITREQYDRFTGMDRYTTQNLANGVTYAQGNRSYINVNNLTVMAPEGMSLVDFLKGLEDYNNGNSLYPVNAMVG